MHARLAEENEPDPLDVFCDLGTLILEARVPGSGDSGRGYGEGPHCPPYFSHAQLSNSNNNNNIHHNNNGGRLGQHVCSPDKLHCQRFQYLRKHACLLGKNGVPLCVEVKPKNKNTARDHQPVQAKQRFKVRLKGINNVNHRSLSSCRFWWVPNALTAHSEPNKLK